MTKVKKYWRMFAHSLWLSLFAMLVLGLFSGEATAKDNEALVGRVVRVADGDTVTILTAQKEQIKVRLNGIDAPEKKQDFGEASRKYLANRIAGKTVTVKTNKRDRYGRTVGVIYLNGADVNIEQVRAGYAWVYKRYIGELGEKEQKNYESSEIAARNARKGLWAQPNPIEPWVWRKNHRAQ